VDDLFAFCASHLVRWYGLHGIVSVGYPLEWVLHNTGGAVKSISIETSVLRSFTFMDFCHSSLYPESKVPNADGDYRNKA
jgi:hypothetical protein